MSDPTPLQGDWSNRSQLRLYKLAWLNSKRESESASMPSTDLVPSGTSLRDDFLSVGFERIEKARIEAMVKDHYFRIAKKSYKKLWRRCGRRTGHDFVTPRSNDYYDSAKNCTHCGKPDSHNHRQRKISGITALANKLREADKQAGIEWIP